VVGWPALLPFAFFTAEHARRGVTKKKRNSHLQPISQHANHSKVFPLGWDVVTTQRTPPFPLPPPPNLRRHDVRTLSLSIWSIYYYYLFYNLSR
jgi:hypothetical protein